jgi:predicted SAM-dependent methyltransferase
MNWSEVRQLPRIRLNLGGGGDSHPDPRYEGYVSVDFRTSAPWSVEHDLTKPIPLPDGSVERLLSEHFVEHVERDVTARILADAHRLLVPRGFFRIAVPDYGSPRNRPFRERGFDPNHTNHMIFPTYPMLRELVAASPFGDGRFYQYWDGDRFVNGQIDYSLGWVKRTVDNDRRNRCDGLGRLLARTLRDAGFVVSRGFRVTRNDLLTQRYHPLRMTSIVIDLRKGG